MIDRQCEGEAHLFRAYHGFAMADWFCLCGEHELGFNIDGANANYISAFLPDRRDWPNSDSTHRS